MENVKTELLHQTEYSSLIDNTKYEVIGNIFPQNIQSDMKSTIKGRMVLLMIEIAYQPLLNSITSYLAKILGIPRQTVNDEIKRLR